LLNNGAPPDEVLALLARGLTNKLMHAPSVQLKKFSAAGRQDALAVASELFALEERPASDNNPQ
jgi:glutamyl-tRNA reductase